MNERRKIKQLKKREGQEESEGDDDIDDDVGDSEGDGGNALKQNVTRIKDVIEQVEFEG